MRNAVTQEVGVLIVDHPLLTMNEIIDMRTHLSKKAVNGKRWNPYSKAKASLEHVISTCAFRDHFRYVGPFWTFCYTTKRRVDPDNLDAGARKLLFDALQRCGKLPSDTFEHVTEMRSLFRRGTSERIVVLSSSEPATQETIDYWFNVIAA